MTNYFPGVNSVLGAGFRYLDNEQRIESNERQQNANRQQRQYEVDQAQERWQAEYEEAQRVNGINAGLKDRGMAVREKESAANIRNTTATTDANIRNTTATTGANVRRSDADTRRVNVATNITLEDRQKETDRAVANTLAGYLEKYDGNAEAAMADPQVQAIIKAASKHPEVRGYIAGNHNIDPDSAEIENIPDTSARVITGKSTVNGERTLATANSETVADNPDAAAIAAPTEEETFYGLLAKGVQSGGTDRVVLDLLERVGVDTAAASDFRGQLEANKAATGAAPAGAAPAEEAPSGFRTPPGGQRSKYRDYPTATPAASAAAPQPAPAPVEQAAPRTNGFRPAAGAALALGMGPDQIADAGQRGTVGKAESNFSRQEQGLDAASERRKDEMVTEADILSPNRELEADIAEAALIGGAEDADLTAGIQNAVSTIQLREGRGILSGNGYETYRTAPNPRAAMLMDIETTLRQPEQLKAIEQELGPLPQQPGRQRQQWFQEASQIVLLSRKGDRDAPLPFDIGDRKSRGEVTDRGLRAYRAGNRPNNLNE